MTLVLEINFRNYLLIRILVILLKLFINLIKIYYSIIINLFNFIRI